MGSILLEDRYKLNYDLKSKVITDIRFKQGNVDTSVLEVTLFNNGSVADITGEIIEFRFEKPDHTIVYQDTASGVSVLDVIHGTVQCVFKSNTLASVGVVRCEIHRAKGGKELTTPSFDFMVESSIGEDGTLSSNYICSIENELINIRTAESDRAIKEEDRVSAENNRVINEEKRIEEFSNLKEDITTGVVLHDNLQATISLGNALDTRLKSDIATVSTIYATKDDINTISSQLTNLQNKLAINPIDGGTF